MGTGVGVGSRAGEKIGVLRRSFLGGGISFEGIGGWFLRMRRWMTEEVGIREGDFCKWGFSHCVFVRLKQTESVYARSAWAETAGWYSASVAADEEPCCHLLKVDWVRLI